ncbi:MAG: DNA-binding protein [Peptococcaceae bacterium]|nr:DNA-binding protein [Peptococcaceae bacterium]
MLSPSLEDYLEEIYRFSMNHDVVRVSDIAACLDVSLPSVSSAIRKLSRKDYLKYKKYKELVLTDKGRRLGRFLVERNRILQDFLRIIQSECDIPAEAEAMEHYLTLPTIRSIENLVDFMSSHPECHQKLIGFCLGRKKEVSGLADGYGNI